MIQAWFLLRYSLQLRFFSIDLLVYSTSIFSCVCAGFGFGPVVACYNIVRTSILELTNTFADIVVPTGDTCTGPVNIQ